MVGVEEGLLRIMHETPSLDRGDGRASFLHFEQNPAGENGCMAGSQALDPHGCCFLAWSVSLYWCEIEN
jgi:hypothetical protein